MPPQDPLLPEALLEPVLAKLGFTHRPGTSFDDLVSIYRAWSHRVPFDNIRKLIHLRSGKAGPLPGDTAEDFFQAWLQHGSGGTCWAGAGALHALLQALGFDATRSIGTMLAAPDLPPNHGTVRVSFGDRYYLVDSGMLCTEPLALDPAAESSVDHAAWGLRCGKRDDRWHIAWRPLHKTNGFECRLERFDATREDFQQAHEHTRGWSPFNFETAARLNREDHVAGIAFGHAVTFESDGGITRRPLDTAERNRVLIEEIGLSEALVSQLPADLPTPPPPGSRTAADAERDGG